MKVIHELASDDYEGRETGSPGCVRAEEYISREFKRLNLTPSGENGTYFHNYSIPVSEASVRATLTVEDRTFFQGYNEDFTVMYKSSWGQAAGEIVFAGYGIFDPDKNRNDYDNIDIENKIVLIKRGAPKNDMAGWLLSAIDSVKAEYCFRNGAKGVLFFEPLIRNTRQVLRQTVDNHLAMISVLPDFPIFSIDERVVRYIFSNAGQSYYRIISLIEFQPVSFATGTKCTMSAKGKNADPLRARNMLGMISGTDRVLKNEFVIIGAHVDHVGMDEEGTIWNGADDNASGVSVLLGIAKAMRDENFRPKRSIVFAVWTGEEMGLLGSKAWCDKPTIDLNKTVVYFNLDMVGAGNGKLNMPGIGFAPEITEYIKHKMDSSVLGNIVWSEGGTGGSDHSNFLNLGIPSFAGMTTGSHPNYHLPEDDPETIDANLIQFTGDFIYQCSVDISTAEEVVLSSKRYEDNRLKLFTFSFFNPVSIDRYSLLVGDKNFRVGIVKFLAGNSDPNENFVKLIYALDSALNNTSGKNHLAGSAYDAMMSRSTLLAAFYPEEVSNDELKIKVLSRLGYRLAILDKNSSACKDTAVLNKLLQTTSAHGVGLILDGLDSLQLQKIVAAVTEPCLIINASGKELSANVIHEVLGKGHIIVYSPDIRNGMESDYSTFMKLQELTGIDHVMLSPSGFEDADLKYLQKFTRQFNLRTINKDAQYKIMGDNFYRIAVRSLQSE